MFAFRTVVKNRGKIGKIISELTSVKKEVKPMYQMFFLFCFI